MEKFESKNLKKSTEFEFYFDPQPVGCASFLTTRQSKTRKTHLATVFCCNYYLHIKNIKT